MTALASLIPWFGTTLGRLAVIGFIAGAWFGWLYHHDSKVENRVISKIEQRNSANVEKATAARRSVETVPLDQLNDRYRRND
ncbi:hypothetical protein DLM45_02235 [Hyphomicrobium methylovorum]|uniref:hypothetical protein n=1 Tax=Hyphomicrobium methylovorum TaxID=84 RepID=UPI0015E7175B|nr:hypothetical protein [Hyphomicrobium methylovorum]MBA2125045.1 hypothetical protein [Hyphomicrobium methylovorum]